MNGFNGAQLINGLSRAQYRWWCMATGFFLQQIASK